MIAMFKDFYNEGGIVGLIFFILTILLTGTMFFVCFYYSYFLSCKFTNYFRSIVNYIV